MALSMDDYADLVTLDAALFQVPVRTRNLAALGIQVFLAEITPEAAAVMLARKNTNRGLRLGALQKICRALMQGRWQINGETIIYDQYGRLIEGQHRLKGVLETGIPLWTLVVYGIDKERFATMGQGSKRTAGDILGIRGAKNARTLAAALRWVYRYENKQMQNPHPNVTDDELADTLPTHEGIEDSIPYGTQCHSVAAPGLCTALHYLCHHRDPGLANHFFRVFGSGENLDAGDPILVLRKRLIAGMTKKTTREILRDEQKAPMIANTWNLIRKEPKVRLANSKRIAWHGKQGETFPRIL